MRIQILQHPLDGIIDKIAFLDVLDVFALHKIQHLAEAFVGIVAGVAVPGGKGGQWRKGKQRKG